MNRVNLITLGTKDISKAHDFYKEIGFETTVVGDPDSPDIVFFRNEGSKISLYPIEHLARDINKEQPPAFNQGGFQGITFAYNTKSKNEVDKILSQVKQAGASVVKDAAPTDWGGYGGYFQDLDGYYWEVAYGEMWEFDEQNMLKV
ncbi:VOC family protein [Alkalihalophilus marmarensis]|uniref:VOC family protein n=1 Tax=Alkalihalophilus marmarensis TaxID=521377 RepID=UPI002DB86554|nr:VOC family protein [Alkalihalophilus marmarensis]MEC2074086.1 VOC family protein [Alkalihalophilus marmarensis]